MSEQGHYIRLRPSGEFAALLSEVCSRYTGTDTLRIDEFGVELLKRGMKFDRVRRSSDDATIDFVFIGHNMAYKLEIPILWDAKKARLYTKLNGENATDSEEGWHLDTLIPLVALNPPIEVK